MNQSEFLSMTCDLHNAKENSHIEGVIAFSFACHWLEIYSTKFLSQSHLIVAIAIASLLLAVT